METNDTQQTTAGGMEVPFYLSRLTANDLAMTLEVTGDDRMLAMRAPTLADWLRAGAVREIVRRESVKDGTLVQGPFRLPFPLDVSDVEIGELVMVVHCFIASVKAPRAQELREFLYVIAQVALALMIYRARKRESGAVNVAGGGG